MPTYCSLCKSIIIHPKKIFKKNQREHEKTHLIGMQHACNRRDMRFLNKQFFFLKL